RVNQTRQRQKREWNERASLSASPPRCVRPCRGVVWNRVHISFILLLLDRSTACTGLVANRQAVGGRECQAMEFEFWSRIKSRGLPPLGKTEAESLLRCGIPTGQPKFHR